MDIRERILTALAVATDPPIRRYYFSDTSREKRQILRLAFNYMRAEKVPGDYLEFGIYRGQTFTYACRAAQRRGLDCRFFAFDSFAGLPEPAGADADFERFRAGEFRSSQAAFERRLRHYRIDREAVVIVPGWFSETLTEANRARLGLTAASVVWIDCDLYTSTVPVLAFIAPLLSEGTVLAFDDWFAYRAHPRRGEQGAAREWLAGQTRLRLVEWRKFGTNGQAFIVNMAE